MSFANVKLTPTYNLPQEQHPQQPQQQQIKTERTVGEIPVWSDAENNILENSPFLENPQMVYKLQSSLPLKSAQQIMTRIKWVNSGKQKPWEEFCVTCQFQPFQLPSTQKPYVQVYKPQTAYEPKPNAQVSQAQIPPNQTVVTQNFSAPINPIVPPMRFSSLLPTKPVPPPQSQPLISKKVIPQPVKIEDDKKMPKPLKIEKEEKPKKAAPSRKRKTKEKELEKVTTQPVPSQGDMEEQINRLLTNNETILQNIEIFFQSQQSFTLDKQQVLAFSTNIKNLLGLTDYLARPARLPFLSLLLDLPPDVSDIQQFIPESQNVQSQTQSQGVQSQGQY
ncbi:hypothetical protein EIN_165410 [Entamoeba invadens IP1]|uniref:Uncharacterized protein n=1 Tax=Entamoeba invadens IP1 TaxID=370355 RepID=A0A0A1U7P5_ENTIV|nr:hypothetical protein EIN_165410 [Entamoeba invadens IP1]ELP89071.1 hypothetical protein EIN_165410 [Entamoeba invadens IP1]|eukprot:XP_004255842.1 hypothetical protein EIN_165410 [Entamoeba invadens IP1]